MRIRFLAFTALSGLALLPVGARAEMNLSLGGYFSGYGVWADNNIADRRKFDLRRDTEVHVSGETTLDNGLTVGFHTEQALGGATLTDEAYAYVSGSWGRINLGSEDGAAYLLQVAAPSADSNIDGLRTYMQAITPATNQSTLYLSTGTGPGTYTNQALVFNDLDPGFGGGSTLDYDHVSDTASPATDRVSYLTPKFKGLQGGISYAPEQGQNDVADALTPGHTDYREVRKFSFGAGYQPVGETDYRDIWELAVRWDAEMSGFKTSLGGGYSDSDIEFSGNAVSGAIGDGDLWIMSGVATWNAGAYIAWQNFSAGLSWLSSEIEVNGRTVDDSTNVKRTLAGDVRRDTWTSGLAWDTGPYHFGVTYLEQETRTPTFFHLTSAQDAGDLFYLGVTNKTRKMTLGGAYTFGPGMELRSSLSLGRFDAEGFSGANTAPVSAQDSSFTQVAVGTQINF